MADEDDDFYAGASATCFGCQHTQNCLDLVKDKE
jgi:hypothetical protein